MILYIEDMMYRNIIAKIVFLLSLMLLLSSKSILAQSDFTHNKDSVVRIVLIINSHCNYQIIIDDYVYIFPNNMEVGIIYAKLSNKECDTIKIISRSRPNFFYKWRYCYLYVDKNKIQECVVLHRYSVHKPSCFEIRYSISKYYNTRYKELFGENYLNIEKTGYPKKIKRLKR